MPAQQLDKAIDDYNEAIRLDPSFSEVYTARGNTWLARKEFDKAIADFGVGLRLDPNDAKAYTSRGLARVLKKEYERAITDFNEAIRLDPRNASAHDNRGLAWFYKKAYDRAIDDCSEAIRVDPSSVSAYNHRGNAWLASKKPDKAIVDYDEAIRLAPGQPYGCFKRAIVEMILRRAEAVADFKRVLDIERGTGDCSKYAVILGHLAARMIGDEREAKNLLDRSPAKPNAAEWPYPVVKLLRGEIDERALLEAAVDDIQRTDARCFLGVDHAIKGHKEEALAHYRWIRDHGDPASVVYTLAVSELERREKEEAK